MTRVSFKFSPILPGHEGLLQLPQNLCGGEGQRSRQTVNILGLLHCLPFYHFILESHVFCKNLPIKQIEYNLALSKYYGAWENTVRVLYSVHMQCHYFFYKYIFLSMQLTFWHSWEPRPGGFSPRGHSRRGQGDPSATHKNIITLQTHTVWKAISSDWWCQNVPSSITDMFVIDHKEKVSLIYHKIVCD